jgi:uncharacterized protein (TIGR02301 family)
MGVVMTLPNPATAPVRNLPLDRGGREAVGPHLPHRYGTLLRRFLAALVLVGLVYNPVQAIDPPYQRQMERLAEIMGSLYFLQPLCQAGDADWRAEMAELIALDEPDEDRRQRLAGAFNAGYTAFARFHRACTPAAREALTRLLAEAQRVARDIHTRFAE